MFITRRLLTELGVSSFNVEKYLPDLNTQLPQHEIDTTLRVAHFLAQVLHESLRMKVIEENLNYSAERLLQVFPKHFTPQEAEAYARKPRDIGSRVYANRLGNGDEASGDGYLFRGRGLIQLTGKDNYGRFSEWIGEDMVARPDLVAKQYAVHSAVYFWTAAGLNALADTDDVKVVTKKVNGGYNGLSDRIALLDDAKKALARETAPPSLDDPTHTVTATRLNFRSRPVVADDTRLGSLSQGTRVKVIEEASVAGWVRIRAVLNGRIVEGFVAAQYLAPIKSAPAPVIDIVPAHEVTLPPVHLTENRPDIHRRRDGGRAYPLGESGRPKRTGTKPATKSRRLLEIIGYLDSENAEHQRYWPKENTTYCNIYAYDYCYLAGTYLPRVWWRENALGQIQTGTVAPVRYGQTVRELNANMLHDWFEDYGAAFDWRRVFTLDELQASANNGGVCIIVAKRRNLNSSGHISVVAPEHDGNTAVRNEEGEVLRPLESQAGLTNHRLFVKPERWWTDARYDAFGFWRHV
jgi:predicted chitinase